MASRTYSLECVEGAFSEVRGHSALERSPKKILFNLEYRPPATAERCGRIAPIKGNQSGLYHVPGGAYYDETNPEECFATAADAKAAGYEASSR
jgi:hypothetical protein